jgi:SulP family sulfate permease
MRFDAPLFFGNANFFRETLEQCMDEKGDALGNVILDASSIYDIDSSGLTILDEILIQLRDADIRFMIAGAIGPLRDRLFRAGMMDQIGAANQFMHVHDAMLALEGTVRKTRHALQTNIRM